jgi:hypothetical protein
MALFKIDWETASATGECYMDGIDIHAAAVNWGRTFPFGHIVTIEPVEVERFEASGLSSNRKLVEVEP